MTKSPYQVLRRPVITEKGLDARERGRTLVFQVHPDANKVEIKQAVQAVFKVKVESVVPNAPVSDTSDGSRAKDIPK